MAHIAHVSESLATGVLSVISTLTHGQTRDGHEVTLFGSQLRGDTPPRWREALPSRVRFVDVPMQREVDPGADLRAVVGLARQLRLRRPDVVHLHSSKAGALGRVACLPLGLPVVYQPHGLAYLRRDVTESTRRSYEWIERLLALLGGTVVACSEGERAALGGVVRRSRSAVVVNGVDLSTVPQANVRVARARVGTCGRISPQKRPEFFAQVAHELRDVADFEWIGDGDVEGKSLLVREGVHVTGWCTRPEALARMGALQIYIQTSAWEGMPVSVIEAMAAGLPVVATDIVGNRDLLAQTAAGVLVRTPSEMATAVAKFVASPEDRQSSGSAGRDLARRLYSADAMVDGYYRLYGIGAPTRSGPVAPTGHGSEARRI
jgi:glycosyltransferase involved in cell wall biosynthesis